jgi:hypothetical protein
MTTRWARVVRGQAVAVIATFAAAFSHGAADGAHPPVAAIALALAFSSIACVLLTARQFSRRRLAASVAISQLVYHGLFSLFGTAGSAPGAVITGHHGSLAFAPLASGPTLAGSTGALSSQALFSQALSSDLWMLVAHLGAAVLTFALVVRGENALSAVRRVADLVVAALSRWQVPQVPDLLPSGRRVATGQRDHVSHRQLILTSSLRHRGPPAQLRFA